MVGNSFVPLQRRRRRSNPPSPTSPVYSRRPLDRPDGCLNVSSPAEAFSATSKSSDSPTLDIDVPSPTFDLPSFSTTSPTYGRPSANNARPGRSSDEYGHNRPALIAEVARPFTSTASAASVPKSYHFATSMAPSSSPSGSGPAPPTFENLGHGGFHHSTRSRGYEQHSPNMRNYSTSSFPTERPFYDEGASNRSYAPKKSSWNILNSMNLLARRRLSPNEREGSLGLTINTLGIGPLPEGEVSIRGNRIHDFSAPRPPGRVVSHDASSGESSPRVDSRPSMQEHRNSSDLAQIPSSPGRPSFQSPKHSPLFKEHFNEDTPALQPAQTAYLQSLANAKNIRAVNLAANQPAFAKRLPLRIPEANESSGSFRSRQDRSAHIATTVKQPSGPFSGTKVEQPSPPPPTPPPKAPPSPPSPKLDLLPAATLPRHMTSTSSRFSFQLGGYDSSAQERILEEKHKQQQASRKLVAIDAEEGIEEDEYGDYDFDDDGLEEKIPGVNADAEDDFEEPIPGINADGILPLSIIAGFTHRTAADGVANSSSLDEFHFTPQVATFTPAHSQVTSEPTPRDEEGHRIGVANSKDSPRLLPPFQLLQGQAGAYNDAVLDGLGIQTSQLPVPLPTEGEETQKFNKVASFDEEDLYFDDGDFDEGTPQSEDKFDEALLDDESQIHDIPAQNARNFDAAYRTGKMQPALPPIDTLASDPLSVLEETASLSVQPAQFGVNGTDQESDRPLPMSNLRSGASLTEDNLAAYHDALVSAANVAAANGRFSRSVSFSQTSDDWGSQSQLDESQPEVSHKIEPSAIAEDDGFPFDEDYGDDLMIAEANAEALENDDDGFYGQEFGFYARAPGKGSSHFTNGGFFGPKGSAGIKRSHSAKANFQEPTLTPITERSEWSPRDSVVSLQIPGIPGSANSLPSPGLVELLKLEASNPDEELSLSALMKLRRGAFGGSSTSINSLSGPHSTSSPLAHYSIHKGSSHIDFGHRMNSSAHSLSGSIGIPESEVEDEEAIGLPALTQSTPREKLSDPSPITPHSQAAISPTLDMPWDREKVGHRRTSSGAESVSYVRDHGSDRWVLERRRTGDSGESEVVGREYVGGARI